MRKDKISDPVRKRLRTDLDAINKCLRQLFGTPSRKSRLPDPIDLLIATILSQNTNDVNSHRAYLNLRGAYPDFRSLADVRPRIIEPLIKVGGIANKKSKTIVHVMKRIRHEFKDFRRAKLRKFERNELIEHLCRLDGVGYKTAACVSLFSLGDDNAFPVDTHIHRILNRIGTVRTRTPDKTYLEVRDDVPTGAGYELHLNLIRFGRKICTSLRPKCYLCPLRKMCRWKEKNEQVPVEPTRLQHDRVDFMHLEKV